MWFQPVEPTLPVWRLCSASLLPVVILLLFDTCLEVSLLIFSSGSQHCLRPLLPAQSPSLSRSWTSVPFPMPAWVLALPSSLKTNGVHGVMSQAGRYLTVNKTLAGLRQLASSFLSTPSAPLITLAIPSGFIGTTSVLSRVGGIIEAETALSIQSLSVSYHFLVAANCSKSIITVYIPTDHNPANEPSHGIYPPCLLLLPPCHLPSALDRLIVNFDSSSFPSSSSTLPGSSKKSRVSVTDQALCKLLNTKHFLDELKAFCPHWHASAGQSYHSS